MACILGYLLLLRPLFQLCIIRVEGVPTLSRSSFSESPPCWHLRVTLTPEGPSYHSCIVHLLQCTQLRVIRLSQIQAHTKAYIAEWTQPGPSESESAPGRRPGDGASASDCDSDVQVAASSTRAKWIHLPGLPGASSAPARGRRPGRPSDY